MESVPTVGWLKRNMNSLKVSQAVLQQYDDVIEHDAVMTDIQDSIGDQLQKNKKTEAVSLELVKVLQKCEGECVRSGDRVCRDRSLNLFTLSLCLCLLQ